MSTGDGSGWVFMLVGVLQARGRESRAAEQYADGLNSAAPVAGEWFITPASAFQLPGADLVVLADGGDRVAAQEIGRRAVARVNRRLLRGVGG